MKKEERNELELEIIIKSDKKIFLKINLNNMIKNNKTEKYKSYRKKYLYIIISNILTI